MRHTKFLLAMCLSLAMFGCSGDQTTAPTEDDIVSVEKSRRPPNTPRPPAIGGAKLSARLSGDNEVPPADPDGRGMIVLTLNPGQERICYRLRFMGIEPPTAMHIHRAAAGDNGPVVVPLSVGDPFRARGCVEAPRELIKEILKNPGDFYVNVHNPEFPPGAIRGQLRKPGRGRQP